MVNPAGEKGPESALPEFSGMLHGGNVLRELCVDGRNAIRPWGVEFADSSAFYSLEDGEGYRYEVLESEETTGPKSREILQVVRMREGLVRVHLNERWDGTREIRHTCTLTCLEDTTLMDFVLRYRFLSARVPRGYIGGREVPFIGSSIYHQYPVDSAAVGNERYSVSVAVLGKTVPACMKAYVYLRDSEDAWVLHLRMLPVAWHKEVIKLCSRWFGTRPVPQWASAALLRVPGVRAALWYRGERRPWRNRIARVFSPNAYPMAHVRKGEVLSWDAVCKLGPPVRVPGAMPW